MLAGVSKIVGPTSLVEMPPEAVGIEGSRMTAFANRLNGIVPSGSFEDRGCYPQTVLPSRHSPLERQGELVYIVLAVGAAQVPNKGLSKLISSTGAHPGVGNSKT